MTISFAGSGNLGSYLSLLLKERGHTIHQVYSRTIENAIVLASKTGARPINDIKEVDPDIDILIVTLPDRIIPDFLKNLEPGRYTAISTSGSVMLAELDGRHNQFGVLYPLQSFTKYTKPDPQTIPIFIEGNCAASTQILIELGKSISNNILEINSDQRLLLHTAAVFASNFTNHIIDIADQIVMNSGLNFKLLVPLINETISRLNNHKANEVQTGPAVRNDDVTIEKHLRVLGTMNDTYLEQVYSLLTQGIKNFNNHSS